LTINIKNTEKEWISRKSNTDQKEKRERRESEEKGKEEHTTQDSSLIKWKGEGWLDGDRWVVNGGFVGDWDGGGG
jgi:hypothetical protein